MPILTEELLDTHLFEKAIWRLLARGAVDAKHAYRLCSIATVNEDGKPDTRTVVMRECDLTNKVLAFHTDIRSGKVSQFNHQPDVCMLFWDPKQSLQLRVYGKAVIHHKDEIALKKMVALPQQQLHLYGYLAAPGNELDSSADEIMQEELIQQHFSWVSVKIHTVDALHLGRSGIHTRVKFQYDVKGLQSATCLKA